MHIWNIIELPLTGSISQMDSYYASDWFVSSKQKSSEQRQLSVSSCSRSSFRKDELKMNVLEGVSQHPSELLLKFYMIKGEWGEERKEGMKEGRIIEIHPPAVCTYTSKANVSEGLELHYIKAFSGIKPWDSFCLHHIWQNLLTVNPVDQLSEAPCLSYSCWNIWDSARFCPRAASFSTFIPVKNCNFATEYLKGLNKRSKTDFTWRAPVLMSGKAKLG